MRNAPLNVSTLTERAWAFGIEQWDILPIDELSMCISRFVNPSLLHQLAHTIR